MRLHSIVLLAVVTTSLHSQQLPTDSLTVEVGGISRVVASEALSRLPRDTIRLAIHDGQPSLFTGVSLADVLKIAGFDPTTLRGPALAQYLVVEARDGYRVIFGAGELDSGITGRAILLAFLSDGKPLDRDQGPWRLVVPGDRRGARWVRQVTALRIRSGDR